MNWLDKLERRYGRLAIPNLMQYICITMVAIYVFDLLHGAYFLRSYAALIPSYVFRGQIWRLVTFVFLPPDSRPVFIFFAIYFYFFIGRDLEYHWGSFRFNIYYLCGVLGCIVAAFLSGYGTNTYLNLSLFLAYAALFPDTEFLLFFVLPVKAKYLAYVDWALFGFTILFGNMTTRLAAVFSLINFFIFFGPDIMRRVKNQAQYRQVRNNFRSQMRDAKRNDPWNNNSPWR